MELDKNPNELSLNITEYNDKRIFFIGKILRRFNIDEFPQFINVLKGDMSVVGPRPHMVSEDRILSDRIDGYNLRFKVRPGITGLAAINGFRGGTNNLELMQKRIDLDLLYIKQWSLGLDIKICFKTFFEIIFLKGKGI